ncbi:hypothetical protein [Massilia brevitalea]|uniref:hypothetical protein n=1 Tax=Massilia brevitalea TaxID=442526 RepID=UPI002739913F|nr:hypothetical protein [Massilia brevitalea]
MWIAVIIPALVACARSSTASAGMRDDARLHRGGNIPVGTLYLDAKTDKEGVTIYDDKGYRIAGSSFLNLKVAKMSSFPGGELGLPRSIRASWLKGPFSSDSNGRWTGGTIVGDHTAPVAERIPAEVIDYLRTKGGSLRLKIRLVDTGVLIGWDIETRIVGQAQANGKVPSAIRYVLAGGDFCERQVYAGQVVEPGWEHPPTSINNMIRKENS